ncbi:MAG TPA: AmmeMemoRadiSam system protein A, partial [Rhodocyclaceae bacterium]|nr:AmmeMemoRadiSam system protein A [Rhodocyclaceae bacterium]
MTASNDLGPVLLILARNAIGEHFGLAPAVTAGGSFPELGEPGACFVTLTRHGQLRGCIGSIEACRPLAADIAENARAAAFRDPRFAPLEFAEFAQIQLEVSLLSKPEPFPASDENDACRQLQPHIDGVVLEC